MQRSGASPCSARLSPLWRRSAPPLFLEVKNGSDERKRKHGPGCPRKQNAAAAPAAAGEKRPRTTRRPYYNRRPRRPQQPKEAATPIHIYPLGGLGEVGKNMTVYECNGDMIIVDCGLVFPDRCTAWTW